MKTPTPRSHRGTQSRLPLARAVTLGILAAGWHAPVRAENVDSEMILLVDITRPGLNSNEFGRLMDGYASAFSSAQILDSIQSGAYGRIAVSMMFFGNSSTQSVGVPWMSIGNATEANTFADLVRNVARPSAGGGPDLGAALAAATLSFGTETGGPANGFESAVQIVEVASGTVPQNGSAAAAAAGSAGALASGVDLINALALGNRANQVDTFYEANVIGSTVNGVLPTSDTAPINAALAGTMSGLLNETVQTGATVSISAVPEPSSAVGLIPATLLLLRRRRR